MVATDLEGAGPIATFATIQRHMYVGICVFLVVQIPTCIYKFESCLVYVYVLCQCLFTHAYDSPVIVGAEGVFNRWVHWSWSLLDTK